MTVSTPTMYVCQLERALEVDPEAVDETSLHTVISTIDFATKQLRSEIESGYHSIREAAMNLLSRSLQFVERLEQRFPQANIIAIRQSIEKRLKVIAPKEVAV